jgi:hypothetical protein
MVDLTLVGQTNLTGGGGLFYATSIPVRPPSALHNIIDATGAATEEVEFHRLRTQSAGQVSIRMVLIQLLRQTGLAHRRSGGEEAAAEYQKPWFLGRFEQIPET